MPFANLLSSHSGRFILLAMLCCVSLPAPSPAQAIDELAEVSRLHAAGDPGAALQRAERFLVTRPRDPQMRFLRAVILADTGRSAEAIAELEKLTQDYPDLPEPHNNLAVLHAAGGHHAQARGELEQALRLAPGYATAHENLGDVQAALARDSYAAAVRLEPGRPGISAKLALVRQLLPSVRMSPTPSPTGASAAASATR